MLNEYKEKKMQNPEFAKAYADLQPEMNEIIAKINVVKPQNMRTFNDMLDKQLQDDEFKKEYEAIQQEMDIIKAGVDDGTL